MTRDRGDARPRSSGRKWLLIAGAAVVFVVIVGLALYATGEPEFCESCHEMKPQVEGWRAGTHKEVSCFACHSNPGIVGYFQAHVGDGLRDVWVHYTERPEKIVVTRQIVPQSRCLACHGDTKKGKAEPFPSVEEYPDHPPKTADCAECHRDATHGPKP